ncbi:hypothetical protein BGW41_002426 [Actinomortierella wolfii]|nr:hypothetical protein BGW41_002426 [Actinomortierella wolfii]
MAQPHKNQAAFREGVEYLFHSWTALKLAVDGEWGGHESAAKRDWFIDTIVDYFGENGKNIDTYDLEDILLQIMNDEFSIMLEDQSEQHIAKILEQLYRDCIHGKYDLVETLKQDSQKGSGAYHSSRAKGRDDEDDDDDDSSDDGEGEEEEEGGSMDVDESESSRPARREKTPPQIDEDGFEMVTKSRRRR